MTATDTLSFRGIEITAQNWRYVERHAGAFSDIALQAEVKFGGGGFARAASYLLQVPESVRADVKSDGTIDANVGGGRYADGIRRAVDTWNRGDRSLKFVAANREMLAREREARDQTGRFVPETTRRAFGHIAAVPAA